MLKEEEEKGKQKKKRGRGGLMGIVICPMMNGRSFLGYCRSLTKHPFFFFFSENKIHSFMIHRKSDDSSHYHAACHTRFYYKSRIVV